jgi:SH3-like domain-containing protein|tara:strand:- start:54 stop:566 length:513 start_codon:yes stop_codon:yes gene_type:complete
MVLARLLSFLVAFTFGTSSLAQITSPISAGLLPPEVGRVTNLPVSRYVSLKAKKANVRRGPGLSYRIDWVFQRRNMPLQITAEYGHWRRVVDRDGEGGWVHYVLLSGARTVIVNEDSLSLRAKPSGTAPVRAELEHNVIAWLGDCQTTWCKLTAGGYTGWAHKAAIWGDG